MDTFSSVNFGFIKLCQVFELKKNIKMKLYFACLLVLIAMASSVLSMEESHNSQSTEVRSGLDGSYQRSDSSSSDVEEAR